MEIHSHSHSCIIIPLLLFLFPWYSHCHSHCHGNLMGSELFPFPWTSLIWSRGGLIILDPFRSSGFCSSVVNFGVSDVGVRSSVFAHFLEHTMHRRCCRFYNDCCVFIAAGPTPVNVPQCTHTVCPAVCCVTSPGKSAPVIPVDLYPLNMSSTTSTPSPSLLPTLCTFYALSFIAHLTRDESGEKEVPVRHYSPSLIISASISLDNHGNVIIIIVVIVAYFGQGAYNSGKQHENLREFVNSWKLRENSGNIKFTQGIYQLIVSLGHRVVCIIVSNSSINWLGDTVTGVDGASHHAHSIKYSVILQESCRTDC